MVASSLSLQSVRTWRQEIQVGLTLLGSEIQAGQGRAPRAPCGMDWSRSPGSTGRVQGCDHMYLGKP